MFQAVSQKKKILVLLGAGLVLLLAVACGSNGNGSAGSVSADRLLAAVSNQGTGLWVNGTGRASGEPDLGILSLGVESLADTASEARAQAAVAIDRTITVLKNNNIADRDLQTSQFRISPRYNTEEVTRCTDGSAPKEIKPSGATEEPATEPSMGMPAPGASPDVVEMIVTQQSQGSQCRVEYERVLIGYQVTNTLTVKVRNLDSMGDIIDGATEAAGDLIRINQVSFTMEDSKPLQEEARAEAIADMLAKAKAMAESAGVKLGDLVFLSESGGVSPQSFARMESAAGFGASDQSTSILAGELDVNVSVQGVFDIGN
ncbi:MAG: SIMPL domain-containing protein [Chloroflexi bacterium]|nr:SIMPL domain-containing protein [Chloroflexota bacterium]MDA1270889.1 SIMPL domain-containing protein [Chloroflexota bacterium]